MDVLREPCMALATLALVPPETFDYKDSRITNCLRELYEKLLSLPSERLTPEVASYAYFPITSLLQKNSLSDAQCEYILRTMTILLKGPWCKTASLKMISQMVAVTTYMISPDPPGITTTFESKANVLRHAGFECYEALFTAADSCGIGRIVGSSPTLANIVLLLLKGLKISNDVQTQLASLRVLQFLIERIIIEPDNLVMILPATASALTSINTFRGKSKNLALNTYTSLLKNCYSDSLSLSKKRNSEWLATSGQQIEKSLQVLANLDFERNRIASEMLLLSSTIVTYCRRNLEVCLPVLLRILLECARVESISNQAKTFICSPEFGLTEYLSKEVQVMLESLGTCFLSVDEKAVIKTLDYLSTGLELCDSFSLLSSAVEKVETAVTTSQSKAFLVEVDYQVSSAENFTASKDSCLESFGLQSSLSRSTQLRLQRLLALIGRKEGEKLLDEIYDRLQVDQQPLATARLLWIANSLLDGFETVNLDVCFNFLQYSLDILDSATTLFGQTNPSLVAIALHTTGILIQKAGKQVKPHLVDLLFPVVNMLGHNNSVVLRQAREAIMSLMNGLGYTSIQELFSENKDYILDGLSVKLRSLDISPATPYMLSSLIQICGPSILPYMDDILETLFVILDQYHGYDTLTKGIFAVFATYICNIRSESAPLIEHQRASLLSSYSEIEKKLNHKANIDLEPASAEELQKFLAGGSDIEKEQEQCISSDTETEVDFASPEKEDWTSPYLKSIYSMVDRVFEKTDRFLTHESLTLKYGLLNISTAAIPILATNEKEFLPRVHQIWPQLVSLIFDEEVFVVEAVFICIGSLCQYAKDFVSSRVDKLWELISSNRDYQRLNTRPWPEYSAEKRRLRALANCLEKVIQYVPISSSVVDEMIVFLKPVFHRKECQSLQTLFEQYYGDQTWLILLDKSLLPPHDNTNLATINPIYI